MKKKYVYIGVSLLAATLTVASCAKPSTTPQISSEPLIEQENKVLVSFDVDGGEEVQSVEITKGEKINAPVTSKQRTDEYTYTFAGWYTDSTFNTLFNFDAGIESNTTIYAKWDKVKNKYTITYLDSDDSILKEEQLEYGTMPSFTPTKDNTPEYSYTFVGWDTPIVSVTGNKTYKAQWTNSKNKYEVVWKNDDEVLKTEQVEYGLTPNYTGDTPTKASTIRYSYEFIGWTPQVDKVTGNVTYNATFKENTNKYKITFVDYNDEEISSSDVEYGTMPQAPANPERQSTDGKSYVFAGWDSEITEVTAAKTYKATYEESTNKYTISFVDYDGTTISSEEVSYGQMPTIPADPTRESTPQYDYVFNGWDSDVVSVTGSKTYTATYTETVRKYTITFVDYNGNTLLSSEVEYGTMPQAPANPTREGNDQYTYTFAGWDSTITSVTGAKTYTATYNETVNKYTITFVDYNGNTLSTSEVEYGTLPQAPANPTRESTAQYDYVFAGWNSEIVEVTGAKTYTATYTETVRKYTITFVNYDGTTLSTSEVEYGSLPQAPANPTREGTAYVTYEFAGWDSEIVSVKEAKTYIATYNAISEQPIAQYTITFVDYDGTLLSSLNVIEGDMPQAPANPTREGNQQYSYEFKGWDSEIVSATENKTYTATYNEIVNKYTITFVDYNGDTLSSSELSYGQMPEAPADPTREQTESTVYTFNGWDSEIVSVTGNKTYTATYTQSARKYTITFVDYNGNTLSTSEVEYGTLPQAPANPTREGNEQYTYTFAGWDTAISTVSGTKTYTATYNEIVNKYTITFVDYDGTTLSSSDVEYGTLPQAPANPTRESTAQYDYVFAGWNSEVVSVTGNKTYTATYSETVRQYTITFVNYDGTTLSTSEVAYGTLPQAPADPTRESSAQYTYTFAGWNSDVVSVTGAKTYTATYDEIIRQYTITFKNGDAVLQEGLFNYGSLPTYNGETPTKEATIEWEYTFVGWDQAISSVDGDKTYEASFTSKKRKYNVSWYNGEDLIYEELVEYGTTPIYNRSNPVKESTNQYDFEFNGWNTEVSPVTGNVSYYASFNEIVRQYTYSFYQEDGLSSYKTITADYGTQIVAPNNPTKSGDLRNSYEFIGWFTSVEGGQLVTSFDVLTYNVSYYARFNRVEKKYTINWMNGEALLLEQTNASYDSEYPNENPTKEGYTFIGWDESIVDNVITRSAKYSENKVEYTVTWLNDDGSLLREDTVNKNDKASYGTKPIKAGFKFLYWALNGEEFDVENESIISDITLKAVYAEIYSVGFGSSYTPWSEVVTAAGSNVTTDSKGRQVLNTDVELNGYTFVNNNKNLVAKDNSSYNNQASNIIVNLPKEGTIVVVCSWASTSSTGYITVTDSNNNEVYKSSSISGSGTACSFTVEDLAKGTYTIHSDYSINITSMHYEVLKEYATINFVTNVTGQNIDPLRIVQGTSLTSLPELQRDNYKFLGWYKDSSLNDIVSLPTTITENTILYAGWKELTANEKATVTFAINVSGESIDSIVIEKGKTIILPSKTIAGYRFDDWYADSNYQTLFNAALPINEDTTIYGNYIKQYSITYKDSEGNIISVKNVDKNTLFGEVATVSAPYVSGYLFEYWEKDGEEYTSVNVISSDIVLIAHYKEDDGTNETINITRTEGLQESAYILFDEYNNADGYSIYEIDNANNTKKLTYKDYYITKTSSGLRADLFGLKAGNHNIMVVPEIDGTDVISLGTKTVFTTEAYDRSGYAHFNYTQGVGAYNDDGTLKDNAIVLYVTDQNKNSVELSYKGITVNGIGNILNSAGKACGEAGHENECKTVSDGKTYYSTANTNQGILKILAQDNIPLVVRFVGCVSNTGLYKTGSFNAANTSLINGLTEYDGRNYGGSVGDNGHMARMKSAKDVTLEGVGSNAIIDGWGFHFMCESASPDLGKSFEVRNLTFINTPEDAVGMEGVQSGSTITASVERCWIHNNEFYCPNITNPAESDKSEGDGSCDFKRGMYFTCSYNYFEGCHKTNLVGSSDSSLQYNLTYHHNYWYMCKARGPLARQANIHMYNNIFYGQTDYAMNTRANAYIYSESNLFYACKNPFRVDGGAIKSYNDSVSSAVQSETNATIVTDKNTQVSNTACAYNGVSYSSFELNNSLFYKNDYYLQEDVTEAKKVIFARTGTANASLPSIDDITMDDISYLNEAVKNVTVNNLSVGSTYQTGKISKTIYAFKITQSAKATITYADNTDAKTGVLCNQAGVALLKASGTVELKPGIYFIQPYNFQPGDSKTLSQLVFKEIASVTISLEEFDDSEYQNTLIDEFNNLVNSLPSPIEYNDTCFNKINAAFAKYNQLNDQSKVTVANKYNTLVSANNTYKNAGISYVEAKINQIISPVTESNADYVYAARSAYNELMNKVPSATISNYDKLTSAEAELERIAVNIFLSKVEELPSPIEYNDTCLQKIVSAENAYDSLTDAQKALDIDGADVVSAYQTLKNARSTYDYLEAEANKVTITFVGDGISIDPIRIKKNTTVTLPINPARSGYRFDGWYTDSARNNKFNESTLVDADLTLYAKFVEQVTVTFINKDGSTLTTKSVDKAGIIDATQIPNGTFVSGYKFLYWSTSANGSQYGFNQAINADLTLYAVYEESNTNSVEVVLYSGDLECLYAEFNKLDSFTDYNVYVKRDGDSSYTLVDKQLVREYNGYYRVDIVGLKAGTYSFKVVPFNNKEYTDLETVITNVSVKAHVREGFGFVNGTSSGAYNDDGTLRSDATVLYVTESNKNTITFAGATGIQNIITLLKAGKGYKKALCIRIIGNITDPATLLKGDLTVDDADSGLTIEGIGNDATINGFGIIIKNSSNVEIRNLGFMNCNSNEGDSVSLQQGNDHCWVHNCDIFYGDAGSDADQAKGDGALDTKTSTYITHSFNHFWDTGKSNLQGMKSESTSNYITYHHNWYDHSDSRHPRIRTCTVHIYNNYFDGNAKYGVGMTMGGSAFVENNYFRSTSTMKPMLISEQGTDALGDGTFSGENGGMIKAYGNYFDGKVSFISQLDDPTSFDAYVASSRDETISSSYKALKGGTTYNNFDTNSSLMYSYVVQSPEDAKNTVKAYAGRVQGGDFKWTFNDEVDDPLYGVDQELKQALVSYKGSVQRVLGIEGGSQGSQAQEEVTVSDVIALIAALPDPANVTLADNGNIYAARSAYQKLSSADQAQVTNYSKLQQCIARLNELGNDDDDTSEVLTFPYNGSYFSVTGNTSTSKGSVTYNGNTYSTCLKMESSTSITFTTTSATTLVMVFNDNDSAYVKLDGEKIGGSNVITVALEAGTHTITKSTSSNLFYLAI